MVYAIIVISTAVLAFVTAFFVVGVRVQGYFDLQTGTAVVDAFVFGHMHVFRYKAFECSGRFYSQINSSDLRQVGSGKKRSKRDNAADNDESEQGSGNFVQKITAIADALTSFPKIRLKRLRAYLTVGTGDSMETSLAAATVASVLGSISVALQDKIKVKEGDIAVFPNFRHENTVLTFDIDAGAGTLGLIFAVFSAVIRAKKADGTEKRRKTA